MLTERHLQTTSTHLSSPQPAVPTRNLPDRYGILRRILFTCVISCLTVSSFAQNLATLYTFQGGADGAFPNPDLSKNGSDRYYGTTSSGGTNDVGTVFRLIPPGDRDRLWTKSVIYNFTGGNDGAFPFFFCFGI